VERVNRYSAGSVQGKLLVIINPVSGTKRGVKYLYHKTP
jgi:hypothetical protein